MEIKIPATVDQKVEVVLDMDDIINEINSRPMKYRWKVIKKILDQVRISELTDYQKEQIRDYLQTELNKLITR